MKRCKIKHSAQRSCCWIREVLITIEEKLWLDYHIINNPSVWEADRIMIHGARGPASLADKWASCWVRDSDSEERGSLRGKDLMSTSGIHTYTKLHLLLFVHPTPFFEAILGYFSPFYFLFGGSVWVQGGGVYMHVWRSETDAHWLLIPPKTRML